MVKLIRAKGYNVFLEIGGGHGYWHDLRQAIGEGAEEKFLSLSLQKRNGVWESFLRTLGQLYVKGIDVNWEGFYGGTRCRRVSLPTYPFDRKRHWLSRKDTGMAVDEQRLGKNEKESSQCCSPCCSCGFIISLSRLCLGLWPCRKYCRSSSATASSSGR